MDGKAKRPKKKLSIYAEFHKAAKEANTEKKFKPIPLDSLNSGQRKVVDLVSEHLQTKAQLLLVISGEGGTGKSHVIKCVRGILSSKNIQHRVASFTGSNANSIKGETLHSLFRVGHFSNFSVVPKNSRVIAHLTGVKFYIVDEASTVGLRFLNYISELLKILHLSDAPFGSCSFLLLGDVAQLRPVGDFSLFKGFNNPNPAEENLYKNYVAFNRSVVLMEQMRVDPQETEFKSLLQRVRVGKLEKDDLEALKGREAKFLSPEEVSDFSQHAIVVFPTRQECGTYNEFRLSKTGKPIINIPARYSDNAPRGINSTLSLSLGTPVVLLKNLQVKNGLFNGSTGFVTEFGDLDSDGIPNVIFVKFKAYTGMRFSPLHHNIPIERAEFPETCPITDASWIKTQFPLEACYSVTAFKVQGLTCKKILIGIPRQGDRNNMFTRDRPSLMYVCLSRVRRLRDLAFTREFYSDLVQTSRHTESWQNEQNRLMLLEAENE